MAGAARRTERLMCLLFLIKSRGRRGITRGELRSCIEDYASCPSESAFERMLERDKSDLRDAGVILDIVQRDNYHEDQAAYVLGEHTLLSISTSFDADELRMLGLAAEAWERGTWSAMAHGALRKLEVFTDAQPASASPRISLRIDVHLAPVREAIRARRSVTFDYRRPGDDLAQSRRVEPWGLLYRRGGWYCVGFDLDREAPRVFRTSRIAGEVQLREAAAHAAEPDWPSIVRGEAVAGESVSALLLARPGHGWTWRHVGRVTGQRALEEGLFDIIEATLEDRDGLVAILASAAPDVLVQSPPQLRDRVQQHLAAVIHD